MTDWVIVPLWRRAGFAEACLRRLEAVMDDEVRVLLCVDCGHDEDTLAVAKRFASRHTGQAEVLVRTEDYPTGSYNVFTGMRDALERCGPGDLVHILEEDILIGRGYFDYHWHAHDLAPGAYAVSACENIFLPDGWALPHEPEAVYLSGAFQVWGSSYRPERVEKILARLRPNYFAEMQAAVEAEFGRTNALRTGPLYDGVMANDIAQQGLHMVFPFVPRGYHAGFEGVSYGPAADALKGSPKQQADRILAMTEQELTELSTLPGARFRTVDLDATPGPVRFIKGV